MTIPTLCSLPDNQCRFRQIVRTNVDHYDSSKLRTRLLQESKKPMDFLDRNSHITSRRWSTNCSLRVKNMGHLFLQCVLFNVYPLFDRPYVSHRPLRHTLDWQRLDAHTEGVRMKLWTLMTSPLGAHRGSSESSRSRPPNVRAESRMYHIGCATLMHSGTAQVPWFVHT